MTTVGEPDGTTVWHDLIGLIGRIFMNAWFVMLTLGVLHASTPSIPVLGYWNSVLAVAVLTSVIWVSNFGIMQRIRTLTPMYGKKIKQPSALDPNAIRELLAKISAKTTN